MSGSDSGLDKARRIMERLVKTPPKPHKSGGEKDADRSRGRRPPVSDQNLDDRGDAK
jgi:hypothetical protein